MTLLYVATALLIVALALFVLHANWQVRSMPRVEGIDPAGKEPLPRLSVVIPARDEAETLQGALETLLTSTYPELEIVLVNDRSTDSTGALMDQIAAADGRVTVVHLDTLPPGWLGKLNALNEGTSRATGEVLLFADVDVHYEPQTLERAVRWMEADRLDHLALMPAVRSQSLLAEAMIGHFGMLFMTFFRPRRVNRGAPGAYVGIGAFNMVRRSTFDRTEGWEWLRLEIGDDVGLGYMLHRHGARSRFGAASSCLQIEWYPSLGAMVRGLEKNLFVIGARGLFHRALLISLGLMLPLAAALVCLLAQWYALMGVLGLALAVSCSFAQVVRSNVIAGAMAPLCGPALAWAMTRSAWRCWRTGRVTWRDTSYDIDELLAGQRVGLL